MTIAELDDRARRAAEQLLSLMSARGLRLATAESLTGGLLGATIVAVPGASKVFRGGMITYASDLKASLLGVDPRWVETDGVINDTVAAQMAAGARAQCGADLALACTGVAGPDPQDGEPAGTVWVALDRVGGGRVVRLALAGDRDQIRLATVAELLELALAEVALISASRE